MISLGSLKVNGVTTGWYIMFGKTTQPLYYGYGYTKAGTGFYWGWLGDYEKALVHWRTHNMSSRPGFIAP